VIAMMKIMKNKNSSTSKKYEKILPTGKPIREAK
jgi:hypothetical protein